MKAVCWMVGASVGAWLAVAVLVDGPAGAAALLGMLAPLGAAALSWLTIESAHARNPSGVTRALLVGFAVKMAFFGAYVAIVLTRLYVRPVPFVASFTASFIGLYAAEAVMLHRLTRRGGVA
jgi:hypothetical protein